MLDVSRVNAQTIYSLNHNLDARSTDSFQFGWYMAKEMILPWLQICRSLHGIQSSVKMKIDYILSRSTAVAAQDAAARDEAAVRNVAAAGAEGAVGDAANLADAANAENPAAAADAAVAADVADAREAAAVGVAGGNAANLFPFPSTGRNRRCTTCIQTTHGLGQKEKKDKMHKIVAQCQRCENPVCSDHRKTICQVCARSLVLAQNQQPAEEN
jgi:hypothetical protein